jgi:hypothetical protein
MREQSSNNYSKHRSHNVSLKKFAGGKSANNRKDKELETQRHEKAAVLRKYAKLCKAEGIQSDRVNLERKSEKPDKRVEKKKESKPAPFNKSLMEAEQRKNEKIASKDEREQKLRKKEELEKSRNEKRKIMLKKTRKGQPIMRNQISAILEKLTKV